MQLILGVRRELPGGGRLTGRCDNDGESLCIGQTLKGRCQTDVYACNQACSAHTCSVANRVLKPQANSLKPSAALTDDACCDCPDGFKGSNVTCDPCLFPERCQMGACVEGATGPGCASCLFGWYQLGSKCAKCGSLIVKVITLGAASIAFGLVTWVVWRLARAQIQEEGEAAVGKLQNIDAMVTSARTLDTLSQGAIYLGIYFFHAQLMALILTLPLPFPEFLVQLAMWIGSLFMLNIGQYIASPECNAEDGTNPVIMLTYRLMAGLAVMPLLMCAVAAVGIKLNERRHALNVSSTTDCPHIVYMV
eukprot:COSAG01_NODE_957_length_12474_cov_44.298182_4_plen_307_part_00